MRAIWIGKQLNIVDASSRETIGQLPFRAWRYDQGRWSCSHGPDRFFDTRESTRRREVHAIPFCNPHYSNTRVLTVSAASRSTPSI